MVYEALIARAAIARRDAEILLAAAWQLSRGELLARAGEPVPADVVARFMLLSARRAEGEPVAYLLGRREFWSLEFEVTPAVLVPRPETELVVELCLARLGAAIPRRVADLGTGTGAIALALAKERPDWRIIATDASGEALDIASINARRLSIPNVELRHGSWCAALDGQFDAIVSNPPYIAPCHPALASLTYEPASALVATDSGFADLRTIATCARGFLRSGALLLLEHGSDQAARLGTELSGLGYREIRCHRDLAGLDRATLAIWP